MAHEVFNSAFIQTVTNLFGDVADLIQKEIALARAEITTKITQRIESAVWFAGAGVLGFLVLLLLAQAAVFGLIAAGLAPAWACVVVAIVVAAIAGGAFAYGKSAVRSSPLPTRSVHQIKEDIRTVKEQLS